MYELSTLGFGPFFKEQLLDDLAIPARIAAEHRGGYEVWSGMGNGSARLAGRLARGLEGEAFPGVGDWVTLRSPPAPGETAIVDGLLDRRTVFVRGAAGKQTRGQVVAANVDLVLVVCALDADCNQRRIERYLARVWASGAMPLVVLNKADACDNRDERVAEVERSCIGVDVLLVSALLSDGLEEILRRLGPGITAAFVGSSGAGKSTLINALLGEERMPTRETSARDGRGTHTTTHRQLIVFPEGGCLIDTPGMRELQLFDDEGIDAVFSDIDELSGVCRFQDCCHQSEPGCAVRAAVEAGDIDADRLEHYRKMAAEARAYEVRHDEHQRRVEGKALAKHIRRFKQGK